MKEKAQIIQIIDSQTYEVSILEDADTCKSCSNQSHCCGSGKNILVFSEKPFQEGDEVWVDIDEKNEAFLALMVFFFPLLIGITGALLSFHLFFQENTFIAFLFFALFFALSFFILKKVEKKSSHKLPKIISKN